MADILENELPPFAGTVDVAQSPRRNLRFPYLAAGFVCAGADALIITASSIVGCSVYQAFSNSTISNFDAFAFAGNVAAILYLGMANAAGFYRATTIFSSQRIYRKILQRWFVVGLLLALFAFLLKIGAIFSRGSIITFILMTAILLLVGRWVATRIFRGAAAEGLISGHRVVLVGSRNELAALDGERLLRDFGLTEIDRVTLPNQKPAAMQLSGEELDVLNQALESARQKGAVEIALALSWSDSRRLDLVRDRMRSSPLPVQLLPDRTIRTLAKNPSVTLKPTLAIELQRGPLSRLEQFVKRTLDILGATIGLILLLPVFLFVALVIKLDSPGPILFRQRRNGFNAKQFTIFKFRTMKVADADNQIVQATRADPRVTRVGRVLRQSSIDELPQLLNVFMGEMSLVGPRPHALLHDSQYSELLGDYAFRHHVKPGITGWAQVNGFRGETSRVEQMQRRVEFDLWYISNWSMMFDIKILLITCFEVVRARNAH